MWDGGREPKSRTQYLPKIEVFSDVYPYFSFRRLPSASAGFRGIPSHRILLEFRQHGMWEGGRKPKVLSRYLPKIEVPSAFLSNFSFRQLPWASVGSRLRIYCPIQTTWYVGGGRKPKRLIRYLPKIELGSDA